VCDERLRAKSELAPKIPRSSPASNHPRKNRINELNTKGQRDSVAQDAAQQVHLLQSMIHRRGARTKTPPTVEKKKSGIIDASRRRSDTTNLDRTESCSAVKGSQKNSKRWPLTLNNQETKPRKPRLYVEKVSTQLGWGKRRRRAEPSHRPNKSVGTTRKTRNKKRDLDYLKSGESQSARPDSDRRHKASHGRWKISHWHREQRLGSTEAGTSTPPKQKRKGKKTQATTQRGKTGIGRATPNAKERRLHKKLDPREIAEKSKGKEETLEKVEHLTEEEKKKRPLTTKRSNTSLPRRGARLPTSRRKGSS